MSLKALITTTYGSSVYKKTSKLQDLHCKAATAKNQMTFLNRCLHHKIIPKFLQIKSPFPSPRVKNIMEQHRRKLLVATRNDTKSRYYKYAGASTALAEEIKGILSAEHFEIIVRVTESSREKKFVEVRTKLKNKFELQFSAKYKRPFRTLKETPTAVKDCVLDLAGNIIDEQLAILNQSFP